MAALSGGAGGLSGGAGVLAGGAGGASFPVLGFVGALAMAGASLELDCGAPVALLDAEGSADGVADARAFDAVVPFSVIPPHPTSIAAMIAAARTRMGSPCPTSSACAGIQGACQTARGAWRSLRLLTLGTAVANSARSDASLRAIRAGRSRRGAWRHARFVEATGAQLTSSIATSRSDLFAAHHTCCGMARNDVVQC